MANITLTCCGGVGTVTGANFLLETSEAKLLVDCGSLQGVAAADSFNRSDFPYDPGTIGFLFVTHAHMDHVGRIPKLVKDGFKGVIYSTPATFEIAQVMLMDAVGLMDGEAREKGILPMYDKKNVEDAFALWKTIEYHAPQAVKGGLSVVLKDAGHILGSTMYEFSWKGSDKRMVFTGDLGNSPALFLKDSEEITDAAYMVIESVYGDRNHEPQTERREKLKSVILDTIARKRNLIIPAFSLERTQDILFEINDLVEKNEVAAVPVFLDSPLGSKVTAIYKSNSDYFKKEAQDRIIAGDDLFNFPRLQVTQSSRESQAIEKHASPKIIIAGSGMSNGGRVTYHEKLLLPDPNTTVLLVGYQSLGTLGRALLDGTKEAYVMGETVPVRATIDMISGYSSHKDSDHLVEFVAASAHTLKKVFVAMGEPKSSLFLVQKIRDTIDVDAVYPKLLEKIVLEV